MPLADMVDILKPDLCIIGAGALGISLAIDARARNLSVVLVQRPGDEPGNTARDEAVRATLMASAARAHAMRTASALGLKDTDPKPSFRAIGERASAIADAVAPQTAPDRLAALGIILRDEPAAFSDRQTLRVGTTLVRAGQFVLATGSHPTTPDLPGHDKVQSFNPDTILANMRKLSHLVVIGGDATALELAQAYRRLGSDVTVVPHGPLLEGFDPEPVAILLRSLRQEGVAILDGASVTAILPRSQGTGIAVAHADGSLDTLDVSHILVAFGRVPDLDPELLEQARLKRDPARPDFLQLSPQGQTSNGRVTAIGGAAGIYDAQSALRQAAIVLQRATGAAAGRINPLLVPHSVNTSPAIAQIGLVETANGLRPGQMVLRANASETTAARASADLPGNTKLITTSDGTILGAAMIGAHSSETIAMLALALERGMGAADLAGLLLPPASPAAQLVDLGRQFIAQHRPSDWARRRAALRRLLP